MEYYSVDGLLSGVTPKCTQHIPDFPLPSRGNVPVLVAGKFPLICGGLDGESSSNICYQLMEDFTWKEIAQMTYGRFHGAGIAVNDERVMVIGGSTSSAYGSSEYVFLDGQVEMGPTLPRSMYVGCFVKIDDTRAILIGGDSGPAFFNFNPSTYYFSIPDEAWTLGPDVAFPGYIQSCGMLVDVDNPSSIFVVKVGGYDGATLVATELLAVNSDEWAPGPDLNAAANMAGPHMTSTLDQKVM